MSDTPYRLARDAALEGDETAKPQALYERVATARFHVEMAVEELTDYHAANKQASILPDMAAAIAMDERWCREVLCQMRWLFERLEKFERTADAPPHITSPDCWCTPTEDDEGAYVHYAGVTGVTGTQ